MYIFFTIFGIVFVILFATVSNFLHDFFEDSLVVDIIAPKDKGLWSKINLTVFPTVIWGLIELPVLGNHNFLLLSVLINLSVSAAVIYVIKIGAETLFKKTNQIINIVSIVIATFVGFLASYILLISSKQTQNLYVNILGLIIFLGVYTMIVLYPPKTEFFGHNSDK